MFKKKDAELFLELIKSLYNNHHEDLGADLKSNLVKAASSIENKEELGLIAVKLYPFIVSEASEKDKIHPKELDDLMQYVLKKKNKYERWFNFNRVGLFR